MAHEHHFEVRSNSARSIGEVKIEQCDNCLALRITQHWISSEPGEPIVWEDTVTSIETPSEKTIYKEAR